MLPEFSCFIDGIFSFLLMTMTSFCVIDQKQWKNLSSDQTLRLQPYKKPRVGGMGSGLGPAVRMLWRYCSQANRGHGSRSPCTASLWWLAFSLRRCFCSWQKDWVCQQERKKLCSLCCVTRAVSTPNSKKKKKDSWINSCKTKNVGRIAEVRGDRSMVSFWGVSEEDLP